MPMNRNLYPKNWTAIAREVKEQAGWTCQGCGKPCRPPGVPLSQTGDWLEANYPDWYNAPIKPHQYTLTVAHLDHTPANCHPDNLKALCAPCHLRYDAPMHAASAAKTRSVKQMSAQHQATTTEN